jgi:site-specific recombinase XerD
MLSAAPLRPNSMLTIAFDLKVFFAVVCKDPLSVERRDVIEFVRAQRTPRDGSTVVRFPDGSGGLALSKVRRRLTSVSGFYSHLVALGETAENPVQRGMAVRSPVTRDKRIVPLVRPVRQLPRMLEVAQVNALLAALRTKRDRAIGETLSGAHVDDRLVGEVVFEGAGDAAEGHRVAGDRGEIEAVLAHQVEHGWHVVTRVRAPGDEVDPASV